MAAVKYAVITFGCRVNQADSLGFEQTLLGAGAAAAPPEEADLVLVNTCSVTASADQGARQTIRRVARANPSARIVVTGCYATRRPDELAGLPGVAAVVANDDKPRLLQLVRSRDEAEIGQVATADRFGEGEGSCGMRIEPGVAGRTAYTLRVQTGCAEPCSYCIIPATRGRPRSVPVAEVLGEAVRAAQAGFREIALTGVHLGSYGGDLAPPASLVRLLRALATAARGDGPAAGVRFRISSLEPMDCTPDIVDAVAGCGCFAAHFHLPLQHASNRVLAAMRRPYTRERYAALAGDIRTRLPNAAIGSDVIVGFPGETEDDFDALTSYLEGSPLTHLHVFPYSDRPGTAAAAMGSKVPGAVVRERVRRIRDISARLTDRFRAGQVGTVHRALTTEDGTLALTGNYLKVRIPPGPERNQWVAVRVLQTSGAVIGEVV